MLRTMWFIKWKYKKCLLETIFVIINNTASHCYLNIKEVCRPSRTPSFVYKLYMIFIMWLNQKRRFLNIEFHTSFKSETDFVESNRFIEECLSRTTCKQKHYVSVSCWTISQRQKIKFILSDRLTILISINLIVITRCYT